jgi:hypothetical protein
VDKVIPKKRLIRKSLPNICGDKMNAIGKNEQADGHQQNALPRNDLSNGLIDDSGIDMTALFLAAYKASRGPEFVLNQMHIKKRFGIGAAAFQSAIRQLKKSNRYGREQPRNGRIKQFAVDHFANVQLGRPGYLIVHADWFAMFDDIEDRQARSDLVKAFAVLIFMRSQAPSFTVENWRISRRFNRTEPTVSKWLKLLVDKELIWQVGSDRERGRFVILQYTAHDPDVTMAKLPTTGLSTTGIQGTHLKQNSNSTKCQINESYQRAPNLSDARRHDVLATHEATKDQMDFDPDDWIRSHKYFQMRDPSAFEQAAAIPMDAEMIKCLKSTNAIKRLNKATSHRINAKLLTSDGIKGFVTLVHWVMRSDDWRTLEEAIDRVIDVTKEVQTRALRRKNGARVNGWAMVGMALDTKEPSKPKGRLGLRGNDVELAANSGASNHSRPERHQDQEGRIELPTDVDAQQAIGAHLRIDDLIKEISDRDYNNVLSGRLLSDKGGLGALVNEFGADRVVEVISQKFTDFMINGPPTTPIASWAYVWRILEHEGRMSQLVEQGIRPGDVLGDWRKMPMTGEEIPF